MCMHVPRASTRTHILKHGQTRMRAETTCPPHTAIHTINPPDLLCALPQLKEPRGHRAPQPGCLPAYTQTIARAYCLILCVRVHLSLRLFWQVYPTTWPLMAQTTFHASRHLGTTHPHVPGAACPARDCATGPLAAAFVEGSNKNDGSCSATARATGVPLVP